MEEELNLDDELAKNDVVTEVLGIIDLDPLSRERERNRISEKYGCTKGATEK